MKIRRNTVVMLMALASCITTVTAERGETPEPGSSAKAATSAQQKPPAGSVVFESPPAPAPGTQFVYYIPTGRWAGSEPIWTVTEDASPFQGRDVYRIRREYCTEGRCRTSRGDFRLSAWDRKTHNLVAVLGRGDVLRYYEPHEFELDWPLWVGKVSVNRIRQVVVRPGRSGRRTGTFTPRLRAKVVGLETIETPMGKFETMHVKATLGRRYTAHLWMARDIPLPIKHRSPNGFTRLLVDIRKQKK